MNGGLCVKLVNSPIFLKNHQHLNICRHQDSLGTLETVLNDSFCTNTINVLDHKPYSHSSIYKPLPWDLYTEGYHHYNFFIKKNAHYEVRARPCVQSNNVHNPATPMGSTGWKDRWCSHFPSIPLNGIYCIGYIRMDRTPMNWFVMDRSLKDQKVSVIYSTVRVSFIESG